MNRPPKVNEYYLLRNSYDKHPGMPGYRSDDWIDRGIYVVVSEDNNGVELRLVSKFDWNGSGRRWIKKSKYTDKATHKEFIDNYEDAVPFLQKELETLKEGYKQILGENI